MSGRERPDIDLVAVAATTADDGADEVIDVSPRPAARAYGRLARATRRPIARRAAQMVIVLGVGAAVAIAVFRGPSPGAAPSSPLVPAACAKGLCSAISMTDAELRHVRAMLAGFSTSGLRLQDEHNVPVLIEVVSTNGTGVLTINAARVAHAPEKWASESIAPVSPQGPDRVVVRNVVRSPGDQAEWVVEVRAISPSGSTTLVQAARRLASDGSLVG
jgi:hypothetical protein